MSLGSDGGPQTRVVNQTPHPIKLRSKYRDVWEGTTFTLAPGHSVLIGSDPCNPYLRFGAFLDTADSAASPRQQPLLMIPQHLLASCHEIALCFSPSSKVLRAEPTG